MKRFFKSLVLSLALIMGVASFAHAQSSRVQIKTNGQKRNVATANVKVNGFDLYSPYDAYLDENRTFVPIRELTELMGADVKWDQRTKSVLIRLNNQDVKLKINSRIVYVDGKKTQMDAASIPRLTQYIDQKGACKTMVPLRFLSESLGFNVDWDKDGRLASISNGVVEAPNNQGEAAPQPNEDPQETPSQPDKDPGVVPEDPAPQENPQVEPQKPDRSKTTVVLDAGHGGHDSGAVGVDGTAEKTLALRLAKKVEASLKQEGYNVIMTRTRDEYPELYERSKLANDANAAIFLSMHFNSAGSSKAYGIEVLYASEKDVSRKKEAGDQTRLANEVLDSVIKETGMHNRGIKNRPELAVLRTTNMSAVLVEGGFMSNPDEMAEIKTDAYLDKLARGIVEGIKNYDQKYL
ncbi:MAG: N-acetylmuramoyl-L-alanine amidase [Peptoniphilus sp.]|nr:N-acetylmuramoyl-L-alanine amidase [Peptoniphilus sp.]MDD7363865.1 N-acetylmuramoyl-L-alanine amidase [Bacillota bacterium]MDY6044296.1 N-acetylmuramoyl-L-alanine amidase [Peptoniphilus sp.]